MATSKTISGNSKAKLSSRQSSDLERNMKSSSSQQSYYPESSSRQSSAKTLPASAQRRFKVPEFKTRPRDTQRIDPDSSMYNEEKLGFSKVNLLLQYCGVLE